MNLTIIYWLLVIVMSIGAVGELLPGIPGFPLIIGSVLAWGFLTKFAGIGWSMVVVISLLVLSAIADFLGSYLGAKRFGASKWGQIGAIVGLVLGVFGLLPALPLGGPLIGLFFGPFIGAFIGEILTRKPEPGQNRFQIALKVSFGTVVGSFIGNIIDGAIAILAVIIFVIRTYPFIPN